MFGNGAPFTPTCGGSGGGDDGNDDDDDDDGSDGSGGSDGGEDPESTGLAAAASTVLDADPAGPCSDPRGASRGDGVGSGSGSTDGAPVNGRAKGCNTRCRNTSSKTFGRSGRVADRGEGGDTMRTTVLKASLNCRCERFRGKAWNAYRHTTVIMMMTG